MLGEKKFIKFRVGTKSEGWGWCERGWGQGIILFNLNLNINVIFHILVVHLVYLVVYSRFNYVSLLFKIDNYMFDISP